MDGKLSQDPEVRVKGVPSKLPMIGEDNHLSDRYEMEVTTIRKARLGRIG